MGFLDHLLGRRRDAFRGPSDREWRTFIPQDVSRVPENEIGRKRAVRTRLPIVLSIVFFATLGGIIYLSLDENAPAVRSAGLRYKTNGFLPPDFVQRVVAAGPEGAARDVRSIKADLEADNQVAKATVRRNADGSLEVTLDERLAVARIPLSPVSGPMVIRLLSPEGHTFTGTGYPEQAVRNLPEIRDFRVTGSGDRMVLEGAEVVGPFLYSVHKNYPGYFRQWSAVSLRDCFGTQADASGSNLRVLLRPSSQPSDRPPLTEIVFSTGNWALELSLLTRINVDSLLRMPSATAPAYVLKLNIQNRTSNPPVPEPRLVPAQTR